MNRSTKITIAVSAVVVAGVIALAVPVVAGAASWASERFAPVAQSAGLVESIDVVSESAADNDLGDDDLVYLGDGISVPAGGPGACTTNSRINIMSQNEGDPFFATLLGELVEMGSSDLASGAVIRDDDGAIVAYEVAPGDSLIAIGERFCVDFVTVSMYNHLSGGMIHPGAVLYLVPDPTIPWVDPHSPWQVEAGTSTIPYFNAVDEFSNAVIEGDLGAARLVWKRLAPDIEPSTAAIVGQALSEDDVALLRRMFP